MENKEDIYYGMFQGGGGHIFKVNWKFILFEVPLYGGDEMFEGCYETLEKAKSVVDGWT